MKCASCRFFKDPGDLARAGECRKSPPLVIVAQAAGLARGQVAINFQSYWPPVGAAEWCGAWESQPGAA